MISTLPFDGYTAPLEKELFINITVKMRNNGKKCWPLGSCLKNGYYLDTPVTPCYTTREVWPGEQYKFDLIVYKPDVAGSKLIDFSMFSPENVPFG